MRLTVLLLCLALQPLLNTTLPFSASAVEVADDHELRDQIVSEHLQRSLGNLERSAAAISPERVVIAGQLHRFYKDLGYRLAWTNRKAVARLVEVIEQSSEDGLDPSDYHFDEIRSHYENPPLYPAMQARADLLMTDAVFTLLSHMRSGKVSPKSIDTNWNIPVSGPGANSDILLKSAVMDAKFPEMIASFRPSTLDYTLLREALSRYRKIAAEGGWKSMPGGPKIARVGQTDSRIPLIRERLILTGDLSEAAAADSLDSLPTEVKALMQPPPNVVYTQELADAVTAFQERHGLLADGIVGNETLGAMDVPVEKWIQTLRVNLERCRWYSGTFGTTYAEVNIPDFSLKLVRDGQLRWTSRVIVGQPDLQTPVFKSEMQSVIFNPKWVVPPGILIKETIPAIRKDMSYLTRHQLTIVDRKGKPVDPETIDWSSYNNGGFPYRLVQASGDAGSLGRIKFNMPNRFTVYLHDTPTKPLFKRSFRAFSHGCVRVDNPFEFGELVLNDPVKWSLDKIKAEIDTGKTQTIPLVEKIPVYFIYQTAFADGQNVGIRFDLYDRDQPVLDALDSPKVRRAVEKALQ